MRLLTALCIAAVVVAFTVPAIAETQNIKVSGDIKAHHIYQSNIDLEADDSDNQNFYLQQVGLNVEADLTDNVSTYVRLINERVWGDIDNDAQTNTFDISLDEAYITLKEMLYAPLTLKIGRQNIWLGKGFVVGNAGLTAWDTPGNLPNTVEEMSDVTAFDAARATLDYDPWTVDLIYSKMEEDNNAQNNTFNYDDVDLYVANVGYDFTKYDAEAEGYYIYKHDRRSVQATNDADAVHTIGIRGSLIPFDNMDVWGEAAFQWGTYANRATGTKADRQAGAINAGGTYTFEDVRWTPKVGVEYTWWSGEDLDANGSPSGDWEAWDPIYPGKFDTYIAAFRNITKTANFQPPTTQTGNDNGATNERQISVIGALEPMTDISVDSRWTMIWYDETPTLGASDELGHELDLKLTYDYTEDVTITTAAGIFWPLEYWPDNSDSAALQLVSGVSVDF
jgi:hypothetical protein